MKAEEMVTKREGIFLLGLSIFVTLLVVHVFILIFPLNTFFIVRWESS